MVISLQEQGAKYHIVVFSENNALFDQVNTVKTITLKLIEIPMNPRVK